MSDALKHKQDAFWKGADEAEVLTFELAGETFAFDAILVQEIVDPLPETAVPGSRPYVASVINFRGKVIPLADIRLAFGMDATKTTIDSRIVVIELDIEGEDTMVGIRTDKVNEVTTLHRSASETPPSIGMRWRPDFISCLVKRGTDFTIVPNLQAIFATHNERSASVSAAG